jgi:hypothetical protein
MLRQLRLALTAFVSLAMSAAAAAQQQNPPEQSTSDTSQQNPPQESPQQQGAQLPPGQFPAVLKYREANFIYRSSANPLACDQLRNHIAVILQAVGARDDIQVTAHECEAFITPDPRSTIDTGGRTMSGTFDRSGTFGRGTGYDPYDPTDRSMNRSTTEHLRSSRSYRGQATPVHIKVMMPVVVTPEIVSEVERDKSRRELISRVTGNPGAAMNDPIFFAAERREVRLSHDTIGIDSIDCELLEQMARSVFRDFDLKVTRQSHGCDSNEQSHFMPHLTVEALLPVGYLMPGEQKERKRAEQKKAAETAKQD